MAHVGVPNCELPTVEDLAARLRELWGREPVITRHCYVTGVRSVHWQEEPTPRPGPGEVLVEIAYTALSPGSNLLLYRCGSYSGEPASEPQEVLYMGSGTITSIGPGVDEYRPGDRVALATGHQSHAVVPATGVHRIPHGLSLRDACMAYLSSWAVSALHLTGYAAAETVVVIGQGLVGVSAALVANQMGARLVVIETDPVRVAFARSLGLSAVQRGTPHSESELSSLIGATGPDLILETSGAWTGFAEAIVLARDWTRIGIMGIYRQAPSPELGQKIFGLLNGFPSKFHYQRLQLIGCGSDPTEVVLPSPRTATQRSNFAYVLEQAERGLLRLGQLITHCLKPEVVQAALEQMLVGDTSMVGVVFEWGKDNVKEDGA